MTSNNQSITHDMALRGVLGVANKIRTFIIGVMILLGIVALNLVDVTLGGFMYSKAFSEFEGFKFLFFTITGTTVGWSLSISLWFVQYQIWTRVWKDGIVNLKEIPFVIVAIALAFIDTFGDSSPVLIYLPRSGIIQESMAVLMQGTPLGKLLVDSIFVAVLLLTGFSELINTFAFAGSDPILFKGAKQKSSKNQPQQGSGYNRPSPQQSSWPFPKNQPKSNKP